MTSFSKHLSNLYPLDLLNYNDLAREIGLIDLTIDSIEGRRLQIKGATWFDFVASNALPLYKTPLFQEVWSQGLQRWGWSWNVPALYGRTGLTEEVQRTFAELTGFEASLVFPTTLHAADGLLPLIAHGASIFADNRSHPITMEGCTLAQARGATLSRFEHNDPSHLRSCLLRSEDSRPRIVVCDAISVAGEQAPFRAYIDLLDEWDGFLYTDDAYGFGIYGKGPTDAVPSGFGGGGIPLHQAVTSDRILYAASLSKPFGLPLSFVAGSAKALRRLLIQSPHQVYSSPPSSLHLLAAQALFAAHAAFGDDRRRLLFQRIHAFRSLLTDLSIPQRTPATFPIQTLYLLGQEAQSLAREIADAKIFCAYQTSPPRFPQGSALRFVFSAEHTEADLEAVTSILRRLFSKPSYRALFVDPSATLPSAR